jgi:hypothetical protein
VVLCWDKPICKAIYGHNAGPVPSVVHTTAYPAPGIFTKDSEEGTNTMEESLSDDLDHF